MFVRWLMRWLIRRRCTCSGERGEDVEARGEHLGWDADDGVCDAVGLMRETSLPRDVVEAAAECLQLAGLVEVRVDDERGYESWRISEAALAAASGGSDGVHARSRPA
ncbi:MAG: hypothetical protein WA731_06860 [Pseudonocardiaceae bacterium]|jgi:hypothetical protein